MREIEIDFDALTTQQLSQAAVIGLLQEILAELRRANELLTRLESRS